MGEALVNDTEAKEMDMPGKIMIVGLGGLSKTALQLMVSKPEIGKIVVASRDVQNGVAFCNLVAAGGIAQGMAPDIEFVPLDLRRMEAAAETFSRVNPDIIFSTATMMSPWLTGKLPLEVNLLLYPAGFGVWLPMHLPLSMRLMQVVKMVDYQGFTLTAPFPDVVNHVLSRIGLAPTSGIGNVDLFIPKIKLLAAAELGVAVTDIQVKMVAHHALMPHFMGLANDNPPPYYLAVMVGNEDVTDKIDARKLLPKSLPVIVGPETNYLTASSAIRLIQGLLSPEPISMHAPAPNGLPGGYPVSVSNQGITMSPINGLTFEEAVQINMDSNPYDSIQSIEPDGSAIFTETAYSALKSAFNFDCALLRPDEAEDRAMELLAKVQERMKG